MKLRRANGHLLANHFVIPANAGIQAFWTSAFAGATDRLVAAEAAQ